VWAAKVAHLAQATRRGYWEALEYLEYVEAHYGRAAAAFELELPLALVIQEARARQKKGKGKA
jgi:hypothetical protein